MSPPASRSTTGAGTAFRFTCAPARRWPPQFTEINIVFKRPPSVLFAAASDDRLRRNTLRIRIQPNEGISLKFNAKVPGKAEAEPVDMDFLYKSGFDHYLPEAYERLIVDAIVGESTLFTRSDEVEQAWRLVDSRQGCLGQAAGARPAALRLRLDGPGRIRPPPGERRAATGSGQRKWAREFNRWLLRFTA